MTVDFKFSDLLSECEELDISILTKCRQEFKERQFSGGHEVLHHIFECMMFNHYEF